MVEEQAGRIGYVYVIDLGSQGVACGRCLGALPGGVAWGRCLGALPGGVVWGRCLGALPGSVAWGRCHGRASPTSPPARTSMAPPGLGHRGASNTSCSASSQRPSSVGRRAATCSRTVLSVLGSGSQRWRAYWLCAFVKPALQVCRVRRRRAVCVCVCARARARARRALRERAFCWLG